MPSISHDRSRHSVIDRRQGHYCCFPDICSADSGEILAVYREADKHTAGRRKLLLRSSGDKGRTWSAPVILNPNGGHCPRISKLPGGQLAVIDDDPRSIYWSLDNGRSWAGHRVHGLAHAIPDRLIELDPQTLLTTAHTHRGTHPSPLLGQAPTEQMVYVSTDRGTTFKPLSVMAYSRRLALCEASMILLPDGRLLALMRENSQVFEPTHQSLSLDMGRTWSEPRPAPMIGHRPCLGLTSSGRILATFRNVGPNAGTAAWLGSVEELIEFGERDGYPVHSSATHLKERPENGPEGLRVRTDGSGWPGYWCCLRPLSDPAHCWGELVVRVRVFHGRPDSFGIRFGLRWELGPEGIRPAVPRARAVKLSPDRVNELAFRLERGQVSLYVNGRKKRSRPIDPGSVQARPVVFGNNPGSRGPAESLWSLIRLNIREPRVPRDFSWKWRANSPLPDAYAHERILELKNDSSAAWPDFGYSGWIETGPDEFLCAYHHGGGNEPGYRPGWSSHVLASRFAASDFPLDRV